MKVENVKMSSRTDDGSNLEYSREKSASEREKGNMYFKSGRYKEALEHYTNGIQMDPSESTLFCNRAMAYLKLKEYAKAKNDCDSAIQLDPSSVKAFYRRALAYLGMNDTDAARENFQRVVELEPSNRQALDELKKLESSKSSHVQASGHVQKASTRHETSSSKKTKKGVEDPFIVNEVKNPPEEWRKQPMKRITNIVEVRKSREDSRTKNTETTGTGNGISTVEEKDDDAVELPPVPSTSLEFFTRRRSMVRHGKDIFGKYFMTIPVESYPALFGRLIDADLLADIITTFVIMMRNNVHVDMAVSISKRLVQLSQLERFNVALAFLEEAQRGDVDEIISVLESLQNSGHGHAVELRDLIICIKTAYTF